MGLILDPSALVAWERAQNAELTLVLDEAEERVMPAVEWQRSWPVCVWPIPPRRPPAVWPVSKPRVA
jgi:hypothetical protein